MEMSGAIEGAVQWAEIVKSFLLFITAVGGAVAAIKLWVSKPIKEMDEKLDKVIEESRKQDEEQRKEIKDLKKTLSRVDENNADLLCDRLETLHQTYMARGWCAPVEKQRVIRMYETYRARGCNHLATHNEEDILNLPDQPPKSKGGSGNGDKES